MRILCRFVGICTNGHRAILGGNTQIAPNLSFRHFRIVDADICLFLEQILTDVNGRGLTGVVGILLKSETEHSNFLIRDGVKHRGNDTTRKPMLLKVVHLDHTIPITGSLGNTEMIAQVD